MYLLQAIRGIIQRGKIIASLVGILIVCMGSQTSTSWAEEIAIRYQVLNTAQGLDTTTWTVELELLNLSGSELSNLSVDLLTSLRLDFNEAMVSLGTLTTNEPLVVIVDFTIRDEYVPPYERPLRFFLKYEAIDGIDSIQRSAIILGQPTVFVGEVFP